MGVYCFETLLEAEGEIVSNPPADFLTEEKAKQKLAAGYYF